MKYYVETINMVEEVKEHMDFENGRFSIPDHSSLSIKRFQYVLMVINGKRRSWGEVDMEIGDQWCKFLLCLSMMVTVIGG